ncbi:Molybdopterin synthase catalytic subunit [Golovinomyces cichoracearum]|uniref:Molybdopterin synthase catalytic subunit n=1 Tax=Golovinomyces cichoracearum TaxID=62708 RepID=A0A420IBC8_9PEZI|nr:Molybdopterin synthase catalytic subunit [Golovinomyces cichoracearum]
MIDRVSASKAEAIVLFTKWTIQDNSHGKFFKQFQYPSYEQMALQAMLKICKNMRVKHSLTSIAIIHRLGEVPIGEDII